MKYQIHQFLIYFGQKKRFKTCEDAVLESYECQWKNSHEEVFTFIVQLKNDFW